MVRPVERVAYYGSGVLDLEHERVEYGPLGPTVTPIAGRHAEEGTSSGPQSPGSAALDAARAVFLGYDRSSGQPDYGAMTVTDDLELVAREPLILGVPRLSDAQTLVEAVGEFDGDAAAAIAQEPPKAAFAPPEYTVVAGSAMLESTREGHECPTECSFELSVEPMAPAISAVPVMPRITATVTEVSPAEATVSWSAQIAYTPFLNPDSCSDDATTSFNSSRLTGSGRSFTPDFGGIYGGELTVMATCSVEGEADVSASETVTIDGTQPAAATIVTELGTMASPFDTADLRRIACLESGLTQFRPSPGQPYLGAGGDAGIMQICYRRTRADLWDWTANIARGRDILMEAKRHAELYLENLVFHSGATRPDDDMWRKEAIHRYNAGTDAEDHYWIWVASTDNEPGMWVANPTGGVTGYVDLVLGKSGTCL